VESKDGTQWVDEDNEVLLAGDCWSLAECAAANSWM